LQPKLPIPFALDNDGIVAHAGALAGKEGIVVVAGTGAITIGIADNQRVRVNGMGHWFGDEGSATWIALQGLRAAARAQDGRGEPTRLVEVLPKTLMVNSLRDASSLLASGDLTKFDLALAAVSIAKVAEEGDSVAQEILRDAASHLAESAFAAAQRLGRFDLPVSFTGGVFRLTPDMPDLFREALSRRLPNAQVQEPQLPPHLGAALLAAKQIGWEVNEGWVDKLVETGKQWGYFDLGAGLVEVLPRLLSEQRNPASMFLDQLDVEAILTLINDEDHKVAPAVRQEIPAIAQAVRWAVRGLSRGSRNIEAGLRCSDKSLGKTSRLGYRRDCRWSPSGLQSR
jgi:N-acetylglucosamine kinase-like BadF-type ATPase